MAAFNYTPDEEIKIHREHAIRQMCSSFQSHENGLPEWVKNSAAAYIREQIDPEERVIVLSFTAGRGSQPSRISCLDFVGMTSEIIDRDFRHWADPEAASRSSKNGVTLGELGGHGNGGKCYMTQMFKDHGELRTLRNGCMNRYGVKGGSVAFGYIPNIEEGKDIQIYDPESEILSCISSSMISEKSLSPEIRKCISNASGFTFVSGVQPKDVQVRAFFQRLLETISSHHQMITSLQLCKIYAFVNGKPYNKGQPLEPPMLKPLKGFEEPRKITIPKVLIDPVSEIQLTTFEDGNNPGCLTILTSEKNMRLGRSGKRRCYHTVTYSAGLAGLIGKIPMQNLNVSSSYCDYLFCECTLDALEPFQQNNRGELAESPLTRAVEEWISEEVSKVCSELEAREKSTIKQKDRNKVSQLNEWLDQWKNQFLREIMHGLYGEGKGSHRTDTNRLPAGIPSRIELSLAHNKAGVGVYFRPSIRFYDSNSHRIRPVPYRWISEDTNVALVDKDLMLIETFSFGRTEIYAELLDVSIQSNHVPLEVVRIIEVRVVPTELEMPAGSRRRLEAICKLSNDQQSSDVYLTWLEGDSTVARVSASGGVYGFAAGQTEVTALDEICRSDVSATITVTEAVGTGSGTKGGRGFPKILISEIDNDIDGSEPAVFRSDEPPISQRPRDVEANVWWLNLASPFARLFFSSDKGYGVDSEAWRMYHVERVIDVLINLAISQGPDAEMTLGPNDWIWKTAAIEAEIRRSAIESLTDFLQSGDMNE